MRTCLRISLLIVLFSTAASAQCYVQSTIKDPPSPDPCKMGGRTARPFPMSYPSLREADVMWSKRIWRKIDLREKLNQPMYYPTEPNVCLMSLFDVLKCAILEGDLVAFANPALDDEFTTPMTKEEVRKLLISWDSTHTVENPEEPGTTMIAPLKTEITSEHVCQYWIKEDWFFDRQRSVMESRIIGICPLTQKLTEDGEVVGVKPLFWVYFPDARPYLARAAVFNRWNDQARMSYDELFEKRMFASYIYKESNVYGRSIAEYKLGIDALLESETIKEDVFKYESNLWHY